MQKDVKLKHLWDDVGRSVVIEEGRQGLRFQGRRGEKGDPILEALCSSEPAPLCSRRRSAPPLSRLSPRPQAGCRGGKATIRSLHVRLRMKLSARSTGAGPEPRPRSRLLCDQCPLQLTFCTQSEASQGLTQVQPGLICARTSANPRGPGL